MQLGGVPETDARWFFQQFIIAVDYCHRLGIANRDIKVRAPRTLHSLSAGQQTDRTCAGFIATMLVEQAWQVSPFRAICSCAVARSQETKWQ